MEAWFKRYSRWVGWSLVCIASGINGASADEAAAREVLQKMTAFYRALPAVSVRSELSLFIEREQEAKTVRQTIEQRLSMERPGRYALISRGQTPFVAAPNAYLSGGKATLLLPEQGRIEQEGIASVEAMLQSPDLGFDPAVAGNLIFDQNMGLALMHKLLFEEVGKGWEEDLSDLRLEGNERLGDKATHHVVVTMRTGQFEGRPLEIHLWVQEGEQPFLLKMKPQLETLFGGADGEQGGGAMAEIAMEHRWFDWNAKPTLADEAFEVAAAKEGEKVFPSFDTLMHGQMTDENPALTLTGKAAPEFSVRLLDAPGERFRLREVLEKEIVVVVFWTTWASPEAEILKALGEVQEALKEAPVRFLAVSLGEDPIRVTTFKQAQDVPPAVVMGVDGEQALVEPYKIRSVPQTVVIGRDGEVKQVHLGMDDALTGELLDKLQTLLAAP